MRDYDFCPLCNGLIEAGGDSWCVCDDSDDYGDYLYHEWKDNQAEECHD